MITADSARNRGGKLRPCSFPKKFSASIAGDVPDSEMGKVRSPITSAATFPAVRACMRLGDCGASISARMIVGPAAGSGLNSICRPLSKRRMFGDAASGDDTTTSRLKSAGWIAIETGPASVLTTATFSLWTMTSQLPACSAMIPAGWRSLCAHACDQGRRQTLRASRRRITNSRSHQAMHWHPKRFGSRGPDALEGAQGLRGEPEFPALSQKVCPRADSDLDAEQEPYQSTDPDRRLELCKSMLARQDA